MFGFEEHEWQPRLLVRGSKVIQFETTCPDGVEILTAYLEENFGGFGYGRIWHLVDGLVLSGMSLAGWEPYYDSIRKDYDTLLNGQPYYRDLGLCDERERRSLMWDRCHLGHAIAKRRYLPEEMYMPTFIEGVAARAGMFRNLADERGIADEAIFEYFKHSPYSFEIISVDTATYSKNTWTELLNGELIVNDDEVPIVQPPRGDPGQISVHGGPGWG